MQSAFITVTMLIATLGTIACRRQDSVPPAAAGPLTAQIVDSGFADAHDTYNAVSCASDGRVYYVLSSQKPDVAASMYSYDPGSGTVQSLGDLNEAAGETGQRSHRARQEPCQLRRIARQAILQHVIWATTRSSTAWRSRAFLLPA